MYECWSSAFPIQNSGCDDVSFTFEGEQMEGEACVCSTSLCNAAVKLDAVHTAVVVSLAWSISRML